MENYYGTSMFSLHIPYSFKVLFKLTMHDIIKEINSCHPDAFLQTQHSSQLSSFCRENCFSRVSLAVPLLKCWIFRVKRCGIIS